MAEEVKKIITVEVGKSITSVRDFKKHIEDLRGALLGLNEESEEYKTIADQIATDQAKLNDVMAIGKKNTDAASGSYNELNNQLKALRQQYKALSETERQGTTGQAILTNITKLDTQLKDIDASMGQYQRNVGNYKQAFDGAFKLVLGEVNKINPQLGTLIKTVQTLIPAFKGVGTAATAAGTSIKAAISSTGIGLLVVALGEIVAHWEEISNWATRVLGIQKDITTETKSAAEQAQILADKYKEARDYAHEISVAQGKTPLEIANEDIAGIENDAQRLRDAEQMIEDYLWKYRDALNSNRTADMAEVNQRGRWFQQDGFITEETREKVKDIYDGMVDDLKKYVSDTNALEEFKKKLTTSSASELQQTLREFGRWLEKQNEINKNLYDKDTQDLAEAQRNQNIERTKYLTGLKKNARDAELALKSEIEQENLLYEEQRQFIIDNIQDQADQNEALENLERAHQAKLAQIRKRGSSSGTSAADEQKKKDLERIKEIKESLKNELQALDDKYVEELTLMEKYGEDTTELTKKWCEARDKIIQDNYKKEQNELKAQEEEKLRIIKEAFQKSLDLQSNTEYLDASAANTMWTINTKTHETDENLEYQKQDRLYQIAEQGYQDRIELYRQYLATLEEGTEEYLDVSRNMHQQEMELAQLQYDYQVELEDRLLEKKRKNLQIMQGMFQAYGELGSTIAGLVADASEEGTQRWKAARITETVINTISGAAGAFMQGMSSYPQPWGAIIGAAGAAVATATGAAQIAKIKSTQIGTSSVSGIAANSSGVGVEPLLNPDYDLQRITNLSLQSDAFLPGNTQVYVLESDIQEVGNRVQVRENNATF